MTREASVAVACAWGAVHGGRSGGTGVGPGRRAGGHGRKAEEPTAGTAGRHVGPGAASGGGVTGRAGQQTRRQVKASQRLAGARGRLPAGGLPPPFPVFGTGTRRAGSVPSGTFLSGRGGRFLRGGGAEVPRCAPCVLPFHALTEGGASFGKGGGRASRFCSAVEEALPRNFARMPGNATGGGAGGPGGATDLKCLRHSNAMESSI